MIITPAIDLIDGKCVRLSQGDYSEKSVYDQTPLEMAKAFQGAGLKRLHLVDLDGAKAGEPKNLAVLDEICGETTLQVDFSGGLRTERDVESAFSAGTQFVAVGSAAVKDPDRVTGWLESFGRERVILGADVKGEKIAISGWTEETEISIFDFVSSWTEQQVERFLCTSIAKDGLLLGPEFELYQQLDERFPDAQFIVSGGVSSLDDLRVLESSGAKEVIIGKALYEGRIKLSDLEQFVC